MGETASPTPFDPARFRRLLESRQLRDVQRARPPVGETIVCLGRVRTTQEEARLLAERGAPHGTIILAEEQVEGRGRRGRSWESPCGAGIWASAILREPFCPDGPHWLTLAGAVASCQAAGDLGAGGAEIKWPNDLMVHGLKFGGVIGEIVADAAAGAGRAAALLGLGINVDLDPRSLSGSLSSTATSLRREGLAPMADREELLAAIVVRLDLLAEALATGGTDLVHARWQALSPSSEGRRVVVEDAEGRGTLRGLTRGISRDGSLAIADESTGLVSHVRFGGTLRFEGGPLGSCDVPGD